MFTVVFLNPSRILFSRSAIKTSDIKNETFEGTFLFKPHYKKINGFQMHYIDEGEGEPIVYVYGKPTWGYLYRKFKHN